MATLAEKQTELALAKESLKAARFALQYGQGDRSLTRAGIPDLETSVARLSREVDELTARAAGATSPFMVTAAYR